MKPFLISNKFDLLRLKTSDGKYVFTSDNLAVYVQSTNPSVPANTGVGVLSEAISCKVTHGPKGYDELEMEYPVDGHLYSDLALRALIVAKVERTRGNQAYRIYRITKPMNERVKIYARHLAYDLAGIVVSPYKASDLTLALNRLKSKAMTNCPFTFTTTRTSRLPFEVKKPTSIWSLMGSGEGNLQDVYNGEYLFDNYTVHFEEHLGTDNNVQVTYGVNMTDFEQDSACDECYTGVVGYWEQDDEVIYSKVITTIGEYDYVKVLTVDMTSYWDEKPTETELEAAVRTYISANDIGVPKVSWTINYVPLDMTEEYKNTALIQQVSLGDTVHVRFEKLGINTTARVIEIEWDVLLDRYSSVSLGDVKKNVATTMAGYATAINNTPTKKEAALNAKFISDTIAKSIMGADGGAVRLLDTNGDGSPDTLYIADHPDPAQAVKVWRFNYEGWGASENGYNGPFVMGATLDGGLMANFITAGVLNANLIKVISSGDVGGGYGDCSMEFDGQFIKGTHDDSGNQTVQIGSQVDIDGNITYVHGDMKMYLFRNYQGQTTHKEIIWLGGERGANGLVVSSPDDSAKASIIYHPDVGIMLQMHDYEGNTFFSVAEDGSGGTLRMSDGTIRCKRLFVNGHEIT